MRAYKFLPAEFALEDIRSRHIKFSRVEDLNDPFELIPFDMSRPAHRESLFRTRDDLAAKCGILSLSRTCKNVLMWAHYADKHQGACLGFDTTLELQAVKYSAKRRLLSPPATFETANSLLSTKSKHWCYEEEMRGWITLKEATGGNYFFDFDDSFKLAEVILGYRCKIDHDTLTEALGNLASSVVIKFARPAFDTFDVCLEI